MEIQLLELRLELQRYFLESYGKNMEVVKVEILDSFVDIFGMERDFEKI